MTEKWTKVEEWEAALFLLGYYTLRKKDGQIAIDNIPGRCLTEAVINFQADFGLDQTGEVDDRTEKALHHALAYGMENTDHQPDNPPEVPEWEDPPKDPNGWKSKYFQKREFACQCGGRFCKGFPHEPDPRLVKLLDQIREHFGRPVIITSGLRCPRHNAEVGGVANSQHLYGTAADIVISGVNPSDVAAYAETLLQNTGGIGRYSSFTHVDVRDVKSRWWG